MIVRLIFCQGAIVASISPPEMQCGGSLYDWMGYYMSHKFS